MLRRVLFKSDVISAMGIEAGEKILTVNKLLFDYQAERESKDLIHTELTWLIEQLQAEPFLNLAWSKKQPFGTLDGKGKIEIFLPDNVDSGYKMQPHILRIFHSS